jgi:hypothetical protein
MRIDVGLLDGARRQNRRTRLHATRGVGTALL